MTRCRVAILGVASCLSCACGSASESDSPGADATVAGGGANRSQGGASSVGPQFGPNDKIAQAICAEFGTDKLASMTQIAASVDKDSTALAGARLAINHKPYMVALPAGRDGWVRLDEFHWLATLAFAAPLGTQFELMDTSFRLVFEAPTQNGACPELNLIDYRAYFEVWINANVRFPAQPATSVPFIVYHQDENLSPPHPP